MTECINNLLQNKAEILVVEDNFSHAYQLRKILESQGYGVTIMLNGIQALEHLANNRPSLIISDVAMPEMDGYQLCHKVKSDENLKDIPFILATALTDPFDIIKGLQCRADNFITLPYQPETLLSQVRHILLSHELRKSGGAELGFEVVFAGQKHFFSAERLRIIDLLLATFENSLQHNKNLQRAIDHMASLEKNYRNLIESSIDGMVVVDKDNIVRYLNQAAEEILEQPRELMVGQPFTLPLALGENKEVNLCHSSGEDLIVEIRVTDISWESESAYLAIIRNITDNVRLREKLRLQSMTDDLTGLYNRRGFLSSAKQYLEIANLTKKNIFLFFIDMDEMKTINDTLGHSTGDEVIMETARILQETFRGSDIIARIGGDEFAVIVLGAQKNAAQLLITRLREKITAFNTLSRKDYQLSISIGVANYDPTIPCNLDDLLMKADKQMYKEKVGKKGLSQQEEAVTQRHLSLL